jgi:uncharacterized membrane protein
MNPAQNTDGTDGDTHGVGAFGSLRGYFLAGILVTAPISITVYLTWNFLQFVDSKVAHLIPDIYNPSSYLPFSLPGIGLIAVVIFFIMVGWFTKNFFGKLLVNMSETVVDRVPVISKIYSALKQIFETIMATQSQAFREVVMLEYPRKGVWSIGFVTGTTEGEVQRTTAEETMNVFVPTTPNPTSGYLLFVPRKELRFMDMTVEEAAKLIVSAGIIVPPDFNGEKEPNGNSKRKSNGKKANANGNGKKS